MISVENLTVEFSARPLFHDVSFVVNDHDRIALVGKNGAGKSTLLKILCGLQRPTSGAVNVPSGETIGYLPQVMKLSDDTTVREETRKAFAGHTEMKARLDRMQREMAQRTDYESESYLELIDSFTQAQDRFMMMGGDNYEAAMERTLTGLGFERTDFDRPTREFSGGWRMRIELAKILLQGPDVLLLDEPTNHLDIESIQWLEQFIQNSSSAVVLVSHDRAFINNITNRTLEITCGHVEDYKVKYNEYLELRKERREQQLRAYENQQKEIADIKAFVDRFRYQATKAVQVQQRLRQLEKIKPIEVDEVDNRTMHLKFPPCLRSGDYPVICDDVRKDYGSKTVFSHVDLTIRRGEKVAFVGRNGEGKSTLVKCIMGEIPFSGNLKIGHNVQIGYFAQNQAQLLDESLSIYDTIDQVATGEMRLKINDLLGAFMFGGEVSEKYVKVLSGGERSRLAMIRLLLEPVNLLILDEPTNHLDMPSKDVLKEAIKAFDGTAIIVSHDRDFLDGLVSKVYEFGEGKVREHLGGIYDYLRAHNAESIHEALGEGKNEAPSAAVTASPVVATPAEKAPADENTDNKQSYQEHKEQQKKIRKAQRAVEEAEKKIASLEARIKELDALLMDSRNASNMELVTEYTSTQAALDRENNRWMELSEALETLG
ncbi:MAG: ABC-F family ATP-binding cassette domain-containing protein [Prevotella sp.]|nr:ABC-F family ATP-binding cassette domain-containing protein [Prevotella sp.]